MRWKREQGVGEEIRLMLSDWLTAREKARRAKYLRSGIFRRESTSSLSLFFIRKHNIVPISFVSASAFCRTQGNNETRRESEGRIMRAFTRSKKWRERQRRVVGGERLTDGDQRVRDAADGLIIGKMLLKYLNGCLFYWKVSRCGILCSPYDTGPMEESRLKGLILIATTCKTR